MRYIIVVSAIVEDKQTGSYSHNELLDYFSCNKNTKCLQWYILYQKLHQQIVTECAFD